MVNVIVGILWIIIIVLICIKMKEIMSDYKSKKDYDEKLKILLAKNEDSIFKYNSNRYDDKLNKSMYYLIVYIILMGGCSIWFMYFR